MPCISVRWTIPVRPIRTSIPGRGVLPAACLLEFESFGIGITPFVTKRFARHRRPPKHSFSAGSNRRPQFWHVGIKSILSRGGAD